MQRRQDTRVLDHSTRIGDNLAAVSSILLSFFYHYYIYIFFLISFSNLLDKGRGNVSSILASSVALIIYDSRPKDFRTGAVNILPSPPLPVAPPRDLYCKMVIKTRRHPINE